MHRRSILLFVLAAVALLCSSACSSIRQRGDAGATETRIRAQSLSAPVGQYHHYADDKRWIAHWPP